MDDYNYIQANINRVAVSIIIFLIGFFIGLVAALSVLRG